jgi:hypothetical protein
MIAEKNLHVPDELLEQAQRMAESQGRTADEVAADALKRYLARQWLQTISRNAEENRRRLGLKTDEEVEEYVERVIAESRVSNLDTPIRSCRKPKRGFAASPAWSNRLKP